MTSHVSRKRLRNGDVPVEEEEEEEEAPPCKRITCTSPAPVTHEAICQEERDKIDPDIRITKEMAMSGKGRPVRVYADGIYDMFHSGHARQLMQAKSAFPNVYLIVGVCDDELTHRRKGRTVMNEVERYEAVRHCRYVDELLTSAPWETDEQFLRRQRIDFVAHDDLPYGGGDQEDIYKWLKDRGQFVATQRTEGISTTDVITRIIKDYDVYLRRNLARGYTAKDLNVSFMKEKRLQFREKVDLMKGKIADKKDEFLNKWEEKSREFVGNFMELFGRDGRINQWITEGRMKVARAISPPPGGERSSRSNSSSPPVKRGRSNWDDDDDDDEDDDDYDDDDEDEDEVDRRFKREEEEEERYEII